MELWRKVCQAATLAEYNQARVELEIADLPLIPKHRDSLFQYSDREYFANGNNQKHCHFWTNRIRHFNKCNSVGTRPAPGLVRPVTGRDTQLLSEILQVREFTSNTKLVHPMSLCQ